MSIISNDLFEVMLRQAVIKNNKEEIALLPSEDELAKIFTFSNEHKRKMKKLFAADTRQETIAVVFKWSKIAIIAACVSVTLMFGTLLTSAEFRNVVGDVIITWFDKFTKFQSQELNGAFIKREWNLEYLPEGFVLLDSYEVGDIKVIEYNNPNGMTIEFSYRPSNFSTSTDNEDMEYSLIVNNDIIYHLFEGKIEHGESMIVWDMGGYRFTIIGNYEIDELLKIAFSVI
ncbi:MAG: DUF4367 domain-containing protein [Oscillospiraceae bacterium]|nr:DUF4367 domain-containing protein [Oscillospiraceae bacterium]